MNHEFLDSIVRAVLYDHTASMRNDDFQRPVSGRVFPQSTRHERGEAKNVVRTECLVEGFASASLGIAVRFLQPVARDIGRLLVPRRDWPEEAGWDFFQMVPSLVVDDESFRGGRECRERTITLRSVTVSDLLEGPSRCAFTFPGAHTLEPIINARGYVVGVVMREQCMVTGQVALAAEPVDLAVAKVTVDLINTTPAPDAMLKEDEALRTFLSAHTILRATGGEFVSLVDPPEARAPAAALCRNRGTWPVLIGSARGRERDVMLSSPIVLGDYPQAGRADFASSRGAATEEILALAPGNSFG